MYALYESCRMLYGPSPLLVPSVCQNETLTNNRKTPQLCPRVVRRTWGLVGADRYRKFDTFFSRARHNKRQWPPHRNRLCSWFMYTEVCGMQIFLLPTHIHMPPPTFKHYVSCGCRWMRFLVRLFCFAFPFLRSCVCVCACLLNSFLPLLSALYWCNRSNGWLWSKATPNKPNKKSHNMLILSIPHMLALVLWLRRAFTSNTTILFRVKFTM